jgi:cytochrome c5
MNDVTGLAVALTATARTRAQQLARDLQAAQRQLNRAGTDLTAARQGYARAADGYRELYAQACQVWTGDELAAAGAVAPPPPPGARRRADS